MDIILVAVQRTHNETVKDQKEQYFGGRKNKNQAIREVTKSRQRYKEKWEAAETIIQAEDLADDEKIVLLNGLIDNQPDDERLADQHASTVVNLEPNARILSLVSLRFEEGYRRHLTSAGVQLGIHYAL